MFIFFFVYSLYFRLSLWNFCVLALCIRSIKIVFHLPNTSGNSFLISVSDGIFFHRIFLSRNKIISFKRRWSQRRLLTVIMILKQSEKKTLEIYNYKYIYICKYIFRHVKAVSCIFLYLFV